MSKKKAFATSRLCKLGQRYEAVDLLLDTIVHYEIAQVCRLWDDFDSTGFSIPTMASLLQGADVRQLLNSPDTDLIVNLRSGTDEFLEAVFAPAVKEAAMAAESQQIKRVKNYRNKVIAHPIYRTRQEIKNKVESIRPDDIEYAVEKALGVVQVFETALLLKPSDYLKVKIEFSQNIKPFYDALECPSRAL